MVELWRRWYPKPLWRRRKGKPSLLVLHHTATPSAFPPERIKEAHEKGRGWPHIGYHFLVAYDGTTYKTLPVSAVPICVREANPQAICVALIGDFTHGFPQEWGPYAKGWKAAKALKEELLRAYPGLKLLLHRDLVPTICPGRASWAVVDEWGGEA